jgi:hypothetical protein
MDGIILFGLRIDWISVEMKNCLNQDLGDWRIDRIILFGLGID